MASILELVILPLIWLFYQTISSYVYANFKEQLSCFRSNSMKTTRIPFSRWRIGKLTGIYKEFIFLLQSFIPGYFDTYFYCLFYVKGSVERPWLHYLALFFVHPMGGGKRNGALMEPKWSQNGSQKKTTFWQHFLL